MTDANKNTALPAPGAEPDAEEAGQSYVGNLLLPLAILALAGVLFVQSLDFPGGNGDVGPAGVPWLWIGFTALFSLILIVQAALRKMKPDPAAGRVVFVISFAIGLSVYLLAIENIGYYVSTFVFLMVSMYVLTYRNFVIMTAVTAGWLVFAYVVFDKLLYIQLPHGVIMRWLVG